MASSSSFSYSMPPPPIPRKAPIDPIAINPNPNPDSDSDSDTATATPSSPRTSRTINQGSKSLAAITSNFLLEDLKVAVSGYQATASYCLGGSIPILKSPSQAANTGIKSRKGKDKDHDKDFDLPKAQTISQPITIRFDSPSPSNSNSTNRTPAIHKITFPLPSPIYDHNSALKPLLQACTPATFGFKASDVLDETYRKAGKLDAESFSTNFHPADFGILDSVKQVLLPGLSLDKDEQGVEREEHRGVRAELYKLNVYSGPSGMFKKHVDTPRGATQFGSLVVCLPCAHEGGQLLISHEEHVSIFDWSTTYSSSSSAPEDGNSLKWCAFYSDCEHEVLPVTAGHRVTLTYNLYVSEQVGSILQRSPTADPWLYPLFEGAKKMLEIPGFMSKGGTLGFYCAHQYAHTRKATDQLMPYALKGIDAVLFAVFSNLGVKVHVRPVLDNDAWSEEEADRDIKDAERPGYIEGESYESWNARQEDITRFGASFEDIVMTDDADGDIISDRIKANWPLVEIGNVQWLNEAATAGWDLAMVHLKYGNEYSLSWHYSHAAIFIDIPPRGERIPIPNTGFGFPDWQEKKFDKD
ncbi:hypothetical protein BKA65DRAFT_547562 [Rhexocercosporidium sp. MPI-PUGE-AT-0058]|nr:hypothetical protein BKA65DRAFT_547562 [Rhexocercosporidium sp. MPI-PUGE-AT-0058]